MALAPDTTTSCELVEIVAARVKAERVDRGMRREDLAKRAEVGLRTVVAIELGTVATTLSTLDRIARALDVPVASLVALT